MKSSAYLKTSAELEAYGWGFDFAQPDKGIDLRHDFYEVDYLPEDDSK